MKKSNKTPKNSPARNRAKMAATDKELSDRQLDDVAGGAGAVQVSEIVVTKPIDVASPKL